MDEQYRLDIKKKVVDEQMAKFWEFCNSSQSLFHERERWECESCGDDAYYDNDNRVVANSIQEFSAIFLKNFTEALKAL